MENINDVSAPLYRRKSYDQTPVEPGLTYAAQHVFHTINRTDENLRLLLSDTPDGTGDIKNYFGDVTVPFFSDAIRAIPDWFNPEQFSNHQDRKVVTSLIDRMKDGPTQEEPIILLDLSHVTMAFVPRTLRRSPSTEDHVTAGISHPPENLRDFYNRMTEMRDVFVDASIGEIKKRLLSHPVRRTLGFLKTASGLDMHMPKQLTEVRDAFEASSDGRKFKEETIKVRKEKEQALEEEKVVFVNTFLKDITINL